MKVDVNSWIGRIAWNENPLIADECSLFRALIWGLFKRLCLRILLPTWVCCALIILVATVIETGKYPFPDVLDDSVFVHWLLAQYYLPVKLFLLSATLMGSMAVTGLLFGGPIWGIGALIIWVGNKLEDVRSDEAHVGNVVVAGISNWWKKLCRPIDVINHKIPSWLTNNSVVICDDVEGVIRDLHINHGRDLITFSFEYAEPLRFVVHGFETCSTRHYMSVNNLHERLRPAHEVK